MREPTPRRAGTPLGRRAALAAGCGLLLAAAFPPYDLPALALPAVAGFTLAVRGLGAGRGGVVGLAFGTPFFLALFTWVRVVGADAWVALSLLEACFLAVLGAGLAVVTRRPGWPWWCACLWVGTESLRSRLPFGGLPWGRLGFSQTATAFTGYAAWGGVPLVTFATAACAGLVAAGLLRGCQAVPGTEVGRWVRPPTGAVIRAAGPALAGAAALAGLGSFAPALPVSNPVEESTVRVAVVQGNVPRAGLDFLGQRQAVLRNHLTATSVLAAAVRRGATPRPELVLWPENSSDVDPLREPAVRSAISAAARAVGAPILVGSVLDGPDPRHVQNAGIVWDPVLGPQGIYVKRHPVPFGEYVPLRGLLAGLIGRFDRIPRDFAAGDRPGVLTVGSARVGDVICFEIAYDDVVRDVVTGGGRVIVVQTNNATYGRTGQPEQQLAISRLRAVEHGRGVLVAATSGISAVIDPDGTLAHVSREFTQDVTVRPVTLRDRRTISDRVGALPEWLLAILGALAFGAAVAPRGFVPTRLSPRNTR